MPTEGVDVQILSGDTITLDTTHIWGSDSATPALDILSGGIVNWDNLGSDTLTLKGDFYVRSGGTLTLDGTATLANVLTIKLNYSAALAHGKYNFFIPNGAVATITGYNKTRTFDTNSTSSASGQATIVTTNDNEAGGWVAGDEIIITTTTATKTQSEKLTISSISGTTITCTGNLVSTHAAGAYVGNLTRNIVITSYDTSYGGYIQSINTTTNGTNFDWVEFTKLYAPSTNVGAIYSQNNLSKFYFDYCSLHDVISPTARNGLVLYNSTLGQSGSITNNVFWEAGNFTIYSYQSYDISGVTIDSNLIVTTTGYAGIYGNNRPHNQTITNCIIVGFASWGIAQGTIGKNVTITDCTIIACGSGIYLSLPLGTLARNKIYLCGTGLSLADSAGVTDTDSEYGKGLSGTDYNTSRDIYSNGYDTVKFDNCLFNSATEVLIGTSSIRGAKLQAGTYDQVSAAHKTWITYGSYEKQSSVKYAGSNALKMSPTDASNALIAEATVFAKNTETVAYSCYMRKDVAMVVLPYVKLSGAGITASTATMVDTQDNWQLLTVSGVATEDGFCKIEFVCQNGSGSVYVDDDPDTFAYWFEGDVPVIVPKPSLTANDIWNTQTAGLTASGSVGKHVKGLRNTIEIG